MDKVREAIESVLNYLQRRMSQEAFEDWSALYAQQAFLSGDTKTVEIARNVRAVLNAFDDDDGDEYVRVELTELIRPFVGRPENSVPRRIDLPVSSFDGRIEFNRAA
jgi:hypothetical protein